MRLAWWNLAATLTALSLVSTAAAQHAGTGARFHDPAQISGDPTGLRHANHLGPKYPDRARAAEQTAAPVVAFVVDTSGGVEVPTASFLDDTEAEFRAVVCEMLPQLRFEPLVLGGQRTRVLLVQFYAFNTLVTPDTARVARARALMQSRQETYATQPVQDVIPDLERRPHCDGADGK